MRLLAADPHRAGQLRKLTGAPEWRLRVGDWRALILLDEEQRVIEVTRVLPRGRAYRDCGHPGRQTRDRVDHPAPRVVMRHRRTAVR